MKIVVLGAGGMLGYAVTSYLSSRGHDVTAVARKDFDIATDPFSKLVPLLNRPDAIINCAGVIKPRIAEMPIEHTLQVNAVFPRNLAKHAQREGIPCLHVTTDCVYTGKKGKYDENDLFDADDVYGMSKNAGETTDCMVLRTSIIGEEKGQGRSLLEWARSQAGKEVKGFLNHHWNGVTTLQLAKLAEQILEQKMYEPAIFHVHSPDTVNKYELVSLINEIYGLNMRIQPVDAPTACDRSMTSVKPLSAKVSKTPLGKQIQEMKDFFAAAN